MEFIAKAQFTRVSPQKARLVLDLIKGKRVENALTTLQFTKKRIAPAIFQLLRSAVDNATYLRDEKGLDLDVDNLFVKRAIANDGPRMKRVRPAPMGRAYHYQRRISHVEIALEEKAGRNGDAGLVQTVQEGAPAKKPVRKVVKKAPAKKKPAAKKPAAKKPAKKKKK